MRRRIALSLTLLVAGVIVSSIAGALAPPAPAGSPYLSALSSMAIAPVLAQTCPHQVCEPSPRGGFVCKSDGAYSCSPNHTLGTCTTTHC